MLIITGSFPPAVCGVGDYTSQLLNTEIARLNDWILYHPASWQIGTLVKHIKAINSTGKQIINLQYPTQGYRWSLVPHLLCLYYSWFTSKCFSVTLHEQSQLSFKARVAQKIIILTANRLIFTNDFERKYAIKRLLCVKRRSTVIKIHSNIMSTDSIRPIGERAIDLLNFGHIRPNKGLETYIEVAKELSNKYKVCIAGQVPEGYEDFFLKIKKAALSANIEIRLNLTNSEVSKLLNNTKLVYLPFPDGASERRGSLLASFVNGAVVATTVGKFTTPALAEAIIDISRTSLEALLCNQEDLIDKQNKEQLFLASQMPKSWNEVAQQYHLFLSI